MRTRGQRRTAGAGAGDDDSDSLVVRPRGERIRSQTILDSDSESGSDGASPGTSELSASDDDDNMTLQTQNRRMMRKSVVLSDSGGEEASASDVDSFVTDDNDEQASYEESGGSHMLYRRAIEDHVVVLSDDDLKQEDSVRKSRRIRSSKWKPRSKQQNDDSVAADIYLHMMIQHSSLKRVFKSYIQWLFLRVLHHFHGVDICREDVFEGNDLVFFIAMSQRLECEVSRRVSQLKSNIWHREMTFLLEKYACLVDAGRIVVKPTLHMTGAVECSACRKPCMNAFTMWFDPEKDFFPYTLMSRGAGPMKLKSAIEKTTRHFSPKLIERLRKRVEISSRNVYEDLDDRVSSWGHSSDTGTVQSSRIAVISVPCETGPDGSQGNSASEDEGESDEVPVQRRRKKTVRSLFDDDDDDGDDGDDVRDPAPEDSTQHGASATGARQQPRTGSSSNAAKPAKAKVQLKIEKAVKGSRKAAVDDDDDEEEEYVFGSLATEGSRGDSESDSEESGLSDFICNDGDTFSPSRVERSKRRSTSMKEKKKRYSTMLKQRAKRSKNSSDDLLTLVDDNEESATESENASESTSDSDALDTGARASNRGKYLDRMAEERDVDYVSEEDSSDSPLVGGDGGASTLQDSIDSPSTPVADADADDANDPLGLFSGRAMSVALRGSDGTYSMNAEGRAEAYMTALERLERASSAKRPLAVKQKYIFGGQCCFRTVAYSLCMHFRYHLLKHVIARVARFLGPSYTADGKFGAIHRECKKLMKEHMSHFTHIFKRFLSLWRMVDQTSATEEFDDNNRSMAELMEIRESLYDFMPSVENSGAEGNTTITDYFATAQRSSASSKNVPEVSHDPSVDRRSSKKDRLKSKRKRKERGSASEEVPNRPSTDEKNAKKKRRRKGKKKPVEEAATKGSVNASTDVRDGAAQKHSEGSRDRSNRRKQKQESKEEGTSQRKKRTKGEAPAEAKRGGRSTRTKVKSEPSAGALNAGASEASSSASHSGRGRVKHEKSMTSS